MTTIKQIQLCYDTVQDRLLMRVAVAGPGEMRLWLTRRFVKLLWPQLQALLASSATVTQHTLPSARRDVLAFERQRVRANADFETPFHETDNELSYDGEPLLLSKLQVQRRDGNRITVRLGSNTDNWIELNLDRDMLHSVCSLLESISDSTDWSIIPIAGSSAADTGPAPTLN